MQCGPGGSPEHPSGRAQAVAAAVWELETPKDTPFDSITVHIIAETLRSAYFTLNNQVSNFLMQSGPGGSPEHPSGRAQALAAAV